MRQEIKMIEVNGEMVECKVKVYQAQVSPENNVIKVKQKVTRLKDGRRNGVSNSDDYLIEKKQSRIKLSLFRVDQLLRDEQEET